MNKEKLKDRVQLFKFAFITVTLVAIWAVLVSLSKNFFLQQLISWTGIGILAIYYRWLRRKVIKPPVHEMPRLDWDKNSLGTDELLKLNLKEHPRVNPEPSIIREKQRD